MTLQNHPFVTFPRSPLRIRFESVAAFTPKESEPNANRMTKQQVENLKQIMEQVHFQIEEYESRRQQMLGEIQTVAVELAITVAAKLVFGERETMRDSAEFMTRQLLTNLDQTLQCQVWLHPDDLAAVQELVLSDPQVQTENVRLNADPRLSPGDCRIQTGEIELVSSMQTKLIELRQHLMESLSDVETERRRNENQHRGVRRFPERRATG